MARPLYKILLQIEEWTCNNSLFPLLVIRPDTSFTLYGAGLAWLLPDDHDKASGILHTVETWMREMELDRFDTWSTLEQKMSAIGHEKVSRAFIESIMVRYVPGTTIADIPIRDKRVFEMNADVLWKHNWK